MKLTPRAWEALVTQLTSVVGEQNVKREVEAREGYAQDESDTGHYLPDLVVLAESAEHVSAVLKLCRAAKVPVTPCGARTGKSGGCLTVEGGVALSLERMTRIVEISKDNLTARVQPGVVLGEFMKAVEAQGLFYPPDPNSLEWCTLGGNIAENAGGPRALKYGVTRDYVLGMDWVMPDGERIRVGRQTIKGVAGYDLTGLLVGSEGTLGVATEITVQLLPLPRHVKTALVLFDSTLTAARATSAVLAAGILPRTLELMDEVSIQAVDGRGFDFPAGTGAAVLVEVDGNDADALLTELMALARVCEDNGAKDTLVAQTEGERNRLWDSRRVISRALRALKKHKISEDIAVPRARIPEVVEKLKAMGQRLGLLVATYGHAGDGNLHANILYDSPEERPKVDEAIRYMLELTVAVGGTITGEHGVGWAKKKYLSLEQAEPVIELQRRIKKLFDPEDLLNPGKMFPAARLP